MAGDPHPLPAGLPAPVDDGAADHLPGAAVPPILLAATDRSVVNLADRPARLTVVYCYPRTAAPGEAIPEAWDMIPGARGCTPQSCSFRDRHAEFAALGAEVFGLSTQPTDTQREAAARLHLPFPLLSDETRAFATALLLPTFEYGGAVLLKRLTLVIRGGRVAWHRYPVFPPDADAAEVLAWVRAGG